MSPYAEASIVTPRIVAGGGGGGGGRGGQPRACNVLQSIGKPE